VGRELKKTAEKRIRDLLRKHSYPPLEVIIPVLEKSGRGEQELATQVSETDMTVVKGIKEILGLKDNNMKTLAKVLEIYLAFGGAEFQPVELTESKFTIAISDCPMIHVSKDVGLDVKSKFCDLICASGAKVMIDTVLGPNRGICTWNKALIKGAGKCTLAFELGRAHESFEEPLVPRFHSFNGCRNNFHSSVAGHG
jgi:hypothetical protein